MKLEAIFDGTLEVSKNTLVKSGIAVPLRVRKRAQYGRGR
jgi:hypothetical protein